MNNEHYTIRTRAEETECEVCGYPLYVKDKAVMDLDTSLVYCSIVCSKKDQPLLVNIKPYWDLVL